MKNSCYFKGVYVLGLVFCNLITIAQDKTGEVVGLQQKASALSADIQLAQQAIQVWNQKLKYFKVAIKSSDLSLSGLLGEVQAFESKLKSIQRELNRNPVANRLDIEYPPTTAGSTG